MEKKLIYRWLFSLSFIVVSTAASYINMTDSWYYLPLIRNDYGRAYNETRIRLGRPIIEDEFQPRIKGIFSKRQVWVLPDSLWRKRLHIAKRYQTSKGQITFENDSYTRYVDSVEVHDLVISYDYPTRKESYELKIQLGDSVIRKSIEKYAADSLLTAWKKLLK